MSLYDLKCSKGHTKEVIMKPDEEVKVKCDICGKPMYKCVPTKTNFKLNGSGWTNNGSIGK